MATDVWLTTGEAARILGTSRQHVVDLCNSRRLPFVTIGTHRRIQPLALQAFMLSPSGVRPLRREQLVSLWLHHVVAVRLVTEPSAVMDRARRNLDKLSKRHPSAQPWIAAWLRVLEQGPAAVLQVLTSQSEAATELRQNSPFAGAITQAERRKVLASVRRLLDGQPPDA